MRDVQALLVGETRFALGEDCHVSLAVFRPTLSAAACKKILIVRREWLDGTEGDVLLEGRHAWHTGLPLQSILEQRHGVGSD